MYQILTYAKNKEVGLADHQHEDARRLYYIKNDEDIYPDNENRIGVCMQDMDGYFATIKV